MTSLITDSRTGEAVALEPRFPARRVLAVVALAVLSGLSTIAFVLAPVQEHTATYNWSSATNGVAAALPLVPYQPMALDITVPCNSLASARDGVVLSTYPLNAPSPAGLRLTKLSGALAVSSNGTTVLDRVAVPGQCRNLTLSFTPQASTLSIDGATPAQLRGDNRPQLVGFFTTLAPRDGPSATTTADTRFDSSPSVLKYLFGAAAIAFLALTLLGVRRLDRAGRSRRLPYTVRGAWKPRISDAVVALALFGWAVIGPSTVDDGYIMQILRGRGAAGFVGNYSHWFNAPEAPFGWFYEPYALWSDISPDPVWMRMPSVLIGIASWAVLSRLIAPRLFRTGLSQPNRSLRASTALVPVALAAAFLVWWLPYNSGVRPEPLIAFGTALSYVWVDRARVTRTVLPLCLAGLTAGLTLGVGPTGVIAFGPFLVMLPPLLRWLRSRPAKVLMASAAAVLASVGAALLVMCADQSLAALLAGNRARTTIGVDLSWQQEYVRYDSLFNPFVTEGSVFRRLPVLTSIAAAVLVLVVLVRDRYIPGLRRRVGQTLTLSLAVCFPLIALTPTKFTHHFGAFAVLGAVVLAGALHTVRVSAHRSTSRQAAVYAGAGVVFGLSLYGGNNWWYLSSLGVPFRDRTPALHGITISTPVLALGLLIALVIVVRGTWSGARSPGENRTAVRRCATVLVLALVAGVAAELGSFAVVLPLRAGAYSVGGAGLSSLAGDSCTLEKDLLVEPNKAAGILGTATDASSTAGFPPGGAPAELPLWQSPPSGAAQLQTAWFTLPAAARDGSVPVVVAANGVGSAANVVTVQLRSGPDGAPVDAPLTLPVKVPGSDKTPELADLRVKVPAAAPGATQVRVLATHSGATPLQVAPPRVPVTVPFTAYTAGRTVATDWINAFYYPCLPQPQAVAGRAQVADFRLTGSKTDVESGGVSYAPPFGGTFAGVAAVTALVEIPTYLRNDPAVDVAHLYRLQPDFSSELTAPTLQDVSRQSWTKAPPLLIPKP